MVERVIWGGRYAVYDELASGGMATVYLAARLGPASDVPPVVALKKLSDQFAKQPEFVAMFLDEAHLAARIRHPNVVTTYEFLRTDEGLGIVMDLVIGQSLMALTRGHEESPSSPPFDVSTAVVIGALAGLDAAHEATDDNGRSLNLVHRDVSPHNVLVGADGVARVIDFGVAKAAGRLQTTDVGVLKGKFAYMSPEQIHGRSIDRRTDVYAAGIVLWEALTGRKLFRGKSNEELLTARTKGLDVVPAASSLNPDVPLTLDAITARALSPDPDERYESARAMADAIRAGYAVADVATVAAWVRSRAGAKLDEIEAKRRKIEEVLASTLAESSGRASAPSPVATGARRFAPPIVDIPTSDAAAPDLAPSRSSAPPSASASGKSGSPRRRFADELVVDEPPPGEARLELAAVGPAASRTRASSVGAEHRPSEQPRERKRAPPETRSFRAGFTLIVVLLVVGLGSAAFLRAPAVVKARVLAAASNYGLVLALDRVETSSDGLTLIGVKASLDGCPDIHFAASEVHLETAADAPRVTVSGYDLAMSGAASLVASEFAVWRKASHLPLTVTAKGGHLVWKGGLPAVAEALDVAVDSLPDSTLTLDTQSLLLTLPRGHVGPWRAHVDSTSAETRARIGLDPSQPEGAPSLTFVERRAEGSTWSVDIPRASTFKIGVPAELLGVTSNIEIEAALRAHITASDDALTAEGQVGVYGVPVATAKGSVPVDILVSGAVAGNPAKPLALSGGKLVLGKATSNVSGSVLFAPDGIQVQIDRPSGHGAAVSALTVDTRDWTAAK